MDFDMYAKGQLPAYPTEHHSGLTKRELFAAMLMQGMLAAGRDLATATENAVPLADDLIIELNK